MPDDPPKWCLDFAYVEAGCLFVFGWFVEPGPRLQGLILHLNGQQIDLGRNVVRVPRPDVASMATRARRSQNDYGLVIAAEVGPAIAAGEPIELWIVLPGGSVQQIGAETSGNQARFVHFARGNLLALLHLLGSVPEAQRPRLAAITERARTPAEAQEVAASDPFTVAMICAPTPELMVVVGRVADPRRHPAPIELLLGETMPNETRARRRLRQVPDQDGAIVFVMLAEIGGVPPDRYVVSQRQGGGQQRAIFPRDDIPRGMAALDALLLPMELDLQLTVLEDVADAIAARPGHPELGRLERIWLERVDRLPSHIERASPGLRFLVDQALQVGSHGVFLVGWAAYDAERLRSVGFRAFGMPPYELPPVWIRDQRQDVWTALRRDGFRVDTDELGYTCFVPVGLTQTAGCIITLVQDDGVAMRLRVDITPTPDEPLELIRQILTTFPQTHRDLRRLLDRHVGPAVGALWSARRPATRAPTLSAFGPQPEAPGVSVVVPIYGRHDFIEFQLAQFANDPGMRGQQLIYVIDDPSIYDAVRIAAIDLYGCYEVPFLLVYGQRNAGFACATNLGAAQAVGEFLVLLNSDVLPRTKSWLAALVAAYRAHADDDGGVGAVGPKLLYEDGSVQHAGMRFYRLPVWADMWVNDHPMKGQPNAPSVIDAACDTLTGACLLLRTEDYRALGGLSEDYIIGDFEDSDLCLQLRRSGRGNWLVPSVELYHLERQSQDSIGAPAWRTNLTLYNCWLHNDRWNDDIVRLVEARG